MKRNNNLSHVQFGCGFSAPETWLNFDASPTLRIERLPFLGKFFKRNVQRFPANVLYGDILKGLPVPENSCQGIYCSHVLEHFALDDLDLALQNVSRLLRPGGTFRMVLPDLERLARDYLTTRDARAAGKFMEESCLGVKNRPRGFSGLLRVWLGNSAHLWMWDEESLRDQLRRRDFKEIRRAAYGDAEDKSFNDVEDPGRFAGCLAIQCRK